MKHYSLILIAVIYISSIANAAQNQPAEDVKSCSSLTEVNEAKEKGHTFIEFRGRYWVRVGDEYKGSFKDLETAKKILQRYEGTDLSGQLGTGKEMQEGPFFHPQLVLFPFVDESTEHGKFLEMPDGEFLAASKVMIHPEPLMFDQVSFGPIDLNRAALTISRHKMKDATGPIPDVEPSGKLKTYFAVVGKIIARPNIVLATDSLEFWVGASVIGVDGSTLIKSYGIVEKDLGFKCLTEVPFSTIPPQNLLLFTLAKGKIDTMLCPIENIPPQDTSGYTNHVLCSMLLEMGEDWYPPFDKTTKEEMVKLVEILQSRQRPPGSPSADPSR